MAEAETTFSKTIPPPVLGWSTTQPISQMDPLYAPDIENYFPQNGTVDLRKGKEIFANVDGANEPAITALYNFTAPGIGVFVAASNAASYKLWNITAGGAGTEITRNGLSPAPTYPFFNFQQFKDKLFFNAGIAGEATYYWTGSGTYATVGSSDLGSMTVYKGRLYALDAGQRSLKYSNLDSTPDLTSGFPNSFDYNSICRIGGINAFIGTVTRAKDFSEDELLCIITTSGEVLVYQGNYPGSADWGIIGHYYLPTPLGSRAFFYIGHDLHIITMQGVIPMSGVMSGAKTGAGYLTITEQIDNYFRENYASQLYFNPSWVGINYPRGGYALINIPQAGSSSYIPYPGANNLQLIVNTNSRAWTRFSGQDAYCWATYGDDLYYGTSGGEVYKADTGYVDKDSAGTTVPRTTKLRCAFNYLDDPSMVKIPTECVPIVYESENLSLTLNCDVDYTNNTATSTNTTTGDTSYKIYKPKCGLKADPGKAISIRLDGTVTTKRRSIQAFEVFYKQGGTR